ncbi:MAG: hypothetical protein NXI24_15630 [bacterium]|nr:hypothetical protein [bacterium]
MIWITAAESRKTKVIRAPLDFLRLIAGLALCFAASCASASGGFSVSNVPMESRRFEVVAPGEEATLSWWSLDLGILGLPLSDPPVARAEQLLLSRTDGDALINLRYWNDRSVFLLFVNRQRFHLKADVVRFTDDGGRR